VKQKKAPVGSLFFVSRVVSLRETTWDVDLGNRTGVFLLKPQRESVAWTKSAQDAPGTRRRPGGRQQDAADRKAIPLGDGVKQKSSRRGAFFLSRGVSLRETPWVEDLGEREKRN